MKSISQQIEIASHMAIILVALLISIVFVKTYLLPNKSGYAPVAAVQNQPPVSQSGPYPGMQVSYPDINWAKNGRTLLFVLSTECGFCKASTDFYKQTVQAKQSARNIEFVALFPQDLQQSEKYLKDHDIAIRNVKQSMPFVVGANGFPTLLLVNNSGTVQKAWVGKLPVEQEKDVLASIK